MIYLCTAEDTVQHPWRKGPPGQRVHDGIQAKLEDCPDHDGLPNHEGPIQSGPDAGEEKHRCP